MIVTIESLLKMIYWEVRNILGSKKGEIMANAYFNTIGALCSSKTPKEIFIRIYNRIQEESTDRNRG